MLLGFIFGVLACSLWGMIYIIPLYLSDYGTFSIAMARFACFGAAGFVLCFFFKKELLHLTPKDWFVALNLSFWGNAIYYAFLCKGIQLAGAPIAGMLMSLIPINVALIANRPSVSRSVVVPWRKLWIPLSLIFIGLVIGNIDEFKFVAQQSKGSDFWLGAALSTVSMLLWTWFPIRNGQWLLAHSKVSPVAWTVAQAVSILPLTVICYAAANFSEIGSEVGFLGPHPALFMWLMLLAGVICGWGGMTFWNLMSARLPLALSGQMIIFETIFSVIYAMVHRGIWPSWTLVVGMTTLLIGVSLSLRIFREAVKAATN